MLTKYALTPAGPCNDACECHASGNFCTKYCQCNLASCINAFKGCRCSGLCDRKSCPCHLANRECDADVCHCAGNVMGEPAGRTTCRSMALMRRDGKVRTSVSTLRACSLAGYARGGAEMLLRLTISQSRRRSSFAPTK